MSGTHSAPAGAKVPSPRRKPWEPETCGANSPGRGDRGLRGISFAPAGAEGAASLCRPTACANGIYTSSIARARRFWDPPWSEATLKPAPVGAADSSHGWSEAEPVVTADPRRVRPGRGGGGTSASIRAIVVHSNSTAFRRPSGAEGVFQPRSTGSASLHPWLLPVAPSGRTTTGAHV